MINVLLIDDEEIIRKGLKKTINWAEMGCQIVGEAEDGDEGINLIHSLKPEIVLTDIRMPGLDGLEMIASIKDTKQDCKIIILTGFRNFEYAQEAVKLGAFRFLLKPSRTIELCQTIMEAVKEIKQSKVKKDRYKKLENKLITYYGLSSNDNNKENNQHIENKQPLDYHVQHAISYMKENFSENLTLQSVADSLYISTWYLSKLLKKETGRNFTDILNDIKIAEAKKMLTDPQYKVYEVAEAVGFTDVAYFSKLFKKVTGVTCMKFRNKHHETRHIAP